MISREQLELRRVALMGDHHIVVGHLQEVDYWLVQMASEAEPVAAAGPEDPAIVRAEGDTDGR